MEDTKINVNQTVDDDTIYTVIRNKTKNQKVCLSTIGLEVAPGETVNLKAMFRKAQLADATREIFHFIQYGALEDLSGTPVNTQDPKQSKFQDDLSKKVQQAKLRDMLLEINGCTILTRLEDILVDPATPAEAKKPAKVRYMQLRGWVDDDGKLIEGSSDDDNQEITNIDSWEFKPFDVKQTTI
jgi:hypothetical protein